MDLPMYSLSFTVPALRIPDLDFFHPGSGSRIQGPKKHWIPDPGSGSATLMSTLRISISWTWECLPILRYRYRWYVYPHMSDVLWILSKFSIPFPPVYIILNDLVDKTIAQNVLTLPNLFHAFRLHPASVELGKVSRLLSSVSGLAGKSWLCSLRISEFWYSLTGGVQTNHFPKLTFL